MSTIITPFMRRVVNLFEANDIRVCVFLSRLDHPKVDSPDLGPTCICDEVFPSYSLPLVVAEGRVEAQFRSVPAVALKLKGGLEPLTGPP